MRRTACATPRIVTGLALASAVCLPAAAAIAAQFDYYIKLPPIEGETKGKGKQIEIHSFAWGASQSAGQIQEISGLKYEMDVVESPPTGTLKRGSSNATAGGSAGVAQYNPKELTVDKKVPWNAGQPAPTGSVTVRGKFPSCTVGVRYPTLELGVRGKRYTLADVVVSSCGGSADGGSQPMEEVSFNYAKIKT
ncbi:MAG TPA: hypothetical protein VMN38_07215 [Sphingomicrobium sp.]|nr:hypothetical protein [Sphingomicrobium sp.]